MQIDIYPDAVDITNPGTFPKGCTPEMYLSGEEVTPHSRNPLIASTLFRSKAIESFGSGIRRIRGACDRAGVHFEYLQGRDATTVRFHRNDPFGAQGAESEEAHAGSGKVPAKFRQSSRNEPEGLSERERAAWLYLAEAGISGTADIAGALGISDRATRKVLDRLIASGLVEPVGQSRARRYRLIG